MSTLGFKDGLVGFQLASAYTAGSGTFTLTSGGSGFPATGRVTLVTAGVWQTSADTGAPSSTTSCSYTYTGVSGNVFTGVVAISGFTDRNFSIGDFCDQRMMAEYITDLNTAVAAAGTVTTISIASANGFAGTVANPTTTPALTLQTSITGVLKGTGTALAAAISDTDYQAPVTLTTTGGSGAATFSGNVLNIPIYSGGGGGSVTTVSIVTANGISGTVANPTSTPAITLSLGAITPTSVQSNGVLIGSTAPVTVAQSGGNLPINLALGNWFSGTLTQNATMVISNAVVGQQFTVRFTQAASGGPYTLAQPTGTITWMGSPYTAPSMPTTAGSGVNGVYTATYKVTGTNTYDAWWTGNSST